jgi:1-aminocyclopropane-1-carboxylate deaminase
VKSILHPKLQILETQFSRSILTPINDAVLSERQLQIFLKRDDLLHPIISGNKWRKLKYTLNNALENGANSLISMGGAYSNHLHALAFVGKSLGIKTQGYIRGEQPACLNPTLQDLQKWGMQLHFVSRSEYRQLRQFKHHDSLPDLKPGEYWLPEGGSTHLALQGVAEIIPEIETEFDVLMVACGTGTTLAGLISSVPDHAQVLGVAALKGGVFLVKDVSNLLAEQPTRAKWQILQDYHFGGFGKVTPALTAFMQQFQIQHALPLEPIYTAKTLFAFYDLVEQDYFKAGSRIVMLHTGGLQGWREANP